MQRREQVQRFRLAFSQESTSMQKTEKTHKTQTTPLTMNKTNAKQKSSFSTPRLDPPKKNPYTEEKPWRKIPKKIDNHSHTLSVTRKLKNKTKKSKTSGTAGGKQERKRNEVQDISEKLNKSFELSEEEEEEEENEISESSLSASLSSSSSKSQSSGDDENSNAQESEDGFEEEKEEEEFEFEEY
jgi:hypothetical protein